MTMKRLLFIAVVLMCTSCATTARLWWDTGSVYRTSPDACRGETLHCHHDHVGVRPHTDAMGSYAITVQWSTDRIP